MLKGILIFASGVVVGAIAASFYLRIDQDEREAEVAESIKKAYGWYDSHEKKDDDSEEVISNEEAIMYRKISKESAYGYDKLFESSSSILDINVDPAQKEHPQEDINETPYIISPETYEAYETALSYDGEEISVPVYDKLCLIYYDKDGVLVGENTGEIMNPEETIGAEALRRFGEYAEDTVYVRNERLGADYEVVREHASYSETMGFDD